MKKSICLYLSGLFLSGLFLSLLSQTALLVGLVLSTCPGMAADDEDHTIRPGIGLGILRLGMTKDQVKKPAGNVDGAYRLSPDVSVEFAQWKEAPPKQSPNLRYFYSPQNKLIQINSAAPVPATADGISCASTRSQVFAQYKDLKCLQYRGKSGLIDYCDDIAHGIAFEFTRANDKKDEQLYAIIVHRPGQRVLADRAENSLGGTGQSTK